MSNNYFQFKKFRINQEDTAMKVGVDAVLLGAWANPDGAVKILDIGAGTGLLSLMMAQKSETRVLAVEIDQSAYLQALENIRESEWADRIEIINTSFQNFSSVYRDKFDFIICNPPYFNSTLVSDDEKRTLARHDQSLSLSDLFSGVAKLLNFSGRFAMIYPYDRMDLVMDEASKYRLNAERILEIKGTEKKLPNRFAIEFSKYKSETKIAQLIVRDSKNNEYTKEYKELTKDFYLKF
jgi:tRNA1Val (adenine37-N6)-methyltransferase